MSDSVERMYFPLKIRYRDTQEEVLVATPEEIQLGRSFRVLEINAYSPESDKGHGKCHDCNQELDIDCRGLAYCFVCNYPCPGCSDS